MAIPGDKEILQRFSDILDDVEHTGMDFWRQYEVRDGYRFFYGLDQWKPETKRKLHQLGLKEITFNRIPPFLRSVQGEITRLAGETRYFPTDGPQAKEYAETTNDLGKWMRDQANSDYNNKWALLDSEICGLGFVEKVMDHDMNPDGEPRDYRVSPIECIPDWNALGPNLTEGGHFIRAKFLTKHEFMEMFGDDIPETGIDPRFIFKNFSEDSSDVFESKFSLRNDGFVRQRQDMIMVFDYQFKEKIQARRVENPLQGQQIDNPIIAQTVQLTLEELELDPNDDIWDVDQTDFTALEEEFERLGLGELISQKTDRDKVYRAWISKDKILTKGAGPYENKFTYQTIMCFWDDEKFSPYGYVRALKDPQRVANASFMHMYHSTLSAPKPTVIAEKSAVEDAAEFESQIASRQAVVWAEEGGLGKILLHNPPAIPTGFDAPLQIATDAFVSTTGISLNFAAQEEREIPAILDRQRNEKSLTVLGDLIGNYQAFLKSSADVDLDRMKIMAENKPGRIVTIIGQEGIRTIEMLKEDFRQDFNVMIDQAKPSITQRMEASKQLSEMIKTGVIPEAMKQIVLTFIFENSGLPQSDLDRMKEVAQQQGQQQEQAQEKQQQMQDQIQQLLLVGQEAEVEQTQAQTQETMAKEKKTQADAMQSFSKGQQIDLENQQIIEGNVGEVNLTT